MPYIHEELDKRLQREHAQRIYREFAAEDDGSFDRAIDELEAAERCTELESVGSGAEPKRERIGI